MIISVPVLVQETLSCTGTGKGFPYQCTENPFMYRKPFPVPVQERVQEIVPYTVPGHVTEILNYPDKYR